MLGEGFCRLLLRARRGARLATALKLNILIELDEEERLVLHVGEEVVLPDEGEDAWSAEFEEVGERFAGLTVKDVPANGGSAARKGERGEINAQLRYAFQEDRGLGFALDLALDGEDDGRNVVNIVWPGLDST